MMNRQPAQALNLTLTNSLGTTKGGDLSFFSGADIYLKPNSAVTGLIFYAAADPANGVGGTTLPYLPAFDDTLPTPVALAYSGIVVGAAGACIPFPPQMFPKKLYKIVLVGIASEAVDIVHKG
jgi:hypothetical protein